MNKKPEKAIHSVHSMHYHLVLITKYRRKVINDTIGDELQNMFKRISKPYNIRIQEWNHDQDHIHVLYSATPTTQHSKFINAYKSATSRIIKKNHPEIKQQLWQEQFWSRTYYIATCGDVSLNMIQKYIQEQGNN